MAKTEFKYEIIKELGVVKTNKSGWQREVNIVSWNDAKPKLDIREWAPDHEKMGKGISLSAEEVAIVKEILDEFDPFELEETR
ncbi:MAG: YdbC family protein [Fastidiosipilaceae bacterium]|jgi:hypothetical protein